MLNRSAWLVLSLLTPLSTAQTQEATKARLLKPQQEAFFGGFGTSPAVSGDLLAVSSRKALEVFERSGADWMPGTRLDGILLGDPELTFAADIDLRGETVVGSVFMNSAYTPVVFERDALGNWSGELVQLPGLVEDDPPQVALGPEGIFAFGGQTGFSAGSVAVVRRDAMGAWGAKFLFHPSSAEFDDISDLEFVGDELVVGDIDTTGFYSGTAWVYAPNGNGDYYLAQELEGGLTPATSQDLGGLIGTDGEQIVLSYRRSTYGVAAIFERGQDGTWSETGWLDLEPGTFVNDAAKPIVNGNLIVIGSPDSTQSGFNVGRAHVFERDGSGVWHNRTDLVPEVPDELFRFGEWMALDGQEVLVGAPTVGPAAGQLLQSGQLLRFGLDPLMRNGAKVELSSGGTQELLLRPDYDAAGDTFLLLGSLSGKDPATPIPGTALLLPLVLDSYTTLLLDRLGTSASPMQPSLGTLDPLATAKAVLNVPAGLPSAFLGVQAFHAFVILDAGGQLAFASNPVSLFLVP